MKREEEEEKMNKKDGWKQPAQRLITEMKSTLNPEIEIEPWFVKLGKAGGWSKRYEAVVGGGGEVRCIHGVWDEVPAWGVVWAKHGL